MTLTIRPAIADDYKAFARLFPELATNDPILERAQFVADLLPTTLVAQIGDAIAGYAYFRTMKDVAYIRHIVTAPEARRQGIGRKLMEAISDRARTEGAKEWCLNVKPDNAAAIALYTKMGLVRAFESRALRIAWSDIENLPSGDHHVAVRSIAEVEDETIERALGLIAGEFASARKMDGRVVLALEDDAKAIVGAAVFHPQFPGAYPFRVVHSEFAMPFLRAISRYARRGDEFVNVMIERHMDVADALVAAGAIVRLNVVHMKGPLPS